jgi:glycosyltransferase involved in cell wall biosynthesis
LKLLSVSVVIPAYRAARTVNRAVDSVLEQTRPPVEILVVDDGSPDDLAGALSVYGNRVTLLQKPNGGAASARNLGIEHARGELIAFLDADDYWHPAKLQRQLELFKRYPELGLVAGHYRSQHPGAAAVAPTIAAPGLFDRVLRVSGPEAFALAMMVWTGTVIVRRGVLGAERFVSGLEPAEDRDLWVRLIAAAPVYLFSDPLATAVLEPGSLSRSAVDRDYSNMLRVVHRYEHLLGRKGLWCWESGVYRKWAAGHLGLGQYGEAMRPAWQRLRRQPFSLEAWWVLLKATVLARRFFPPRRSSVSSPPVRTGPIGAFASNE